MPQVSGAANNTNLLVGTTSVPSGQYNVYSPSTRNNYIAGNVGLGQVTPGAQLEVDPAAAGTVGVLVKAAASQTADIAQFQNSSGTNLVQVTSAGNLLEAGVRVANRAGTYITPGSFFTGTVLGSTVYGDWTPGVAVTLARINVRCLTAGSGQTTGTQFQVTDGVTASTATLINAASGTATFSQNYAAGTVLNLRTGTSDGVAPQNCNIVASFTYQ